MTPAEFKAKWARFSGKESAAYQDHFSDLCRVLGVATPIQADPTGNDTFCFQKRVVKDAEFFTFDDSGRVAETPGNERGFADVWKKDCFGWEYKGPGEDLEKAYKQLLRYRESLLNPPLLVVCDFEKFIVRTNFNGAVQETHEFSNAQIDSPEALRVLRAVLTDPGALRPQRTTAEVTETLARQIATIALSLQKRESVELSDAKTRKQHHVAQKKNLRIARFLNRLVFCFFAEDTGLLPPNIFSEICKIGLNNPERFAETLEDLFRCMAKGGRFGFHEIRHFNGHLFHDATVFELTPDEIRALAAAATADWQNIQPSIMGNLFERGLDPGQRAQLGAHYTSEADIKTLVEPVLMAPLRREWAALRRDLAQNILKGKGSPAEKARLAEFQRKIAGVTVLDPACGSGNFLYVALQLLLGLEKEVITAAAQMGWTFAPQVSVQQLRAIELNAYAYELAQVSVQIGFLQWRRDNGFDNDRSPVLQNLDGFENKDALLNETFRKKPKNLKAAQAEEHGGQDDLFKVYTERAWPECDVIVGNPPFLGDKFMRRELGDAYVEELRKIFGNRIPGQSDLCCYWFEKARQQIEDEKCKRAGLLATQGIRGGANREVLKRIKQTGDIFFAESDREWILAGATVHVSMVGFDDRTEQLHILNGSAATTINPNLSSNTDIALAKPQRQNFGLSFIGVSMHGDFDLPEAEALAMLNAEGNPTGQANADVVRPILNAFEITKRAEMRWIIALHPGDSIEKAALYEMPFARVVKVVKPERDRNNRTAYRQRWWIHGEARPAMLAALRPLPRFIATPRVSKHRVFVWMTPERLPSDATVAFARDDDYFFGVLHSRIHEVWALSLGTQLREKESGFRYTPTTCFETFPFPRPTPEREAAIAAAAKELNELRERWLNPPEWTQTRVLEFPGSVDGPWARYMECGGRVPAATPLSQGAPVESQSAVAANALPAHSKIGTVRYPRLEPRDADCSAKLAKRTLTNLYNERPAWLDLAHKKLDAAVAAAYGFPANLADDEILSRLLALNLERAAEEVKATPAKPPKTTRAKQADEML